MNFGPPLATDMNAPEQLARGGAVGRFSEIGRGWQGNEDESQEALDDALDEALDDLAGKWIGNPGVADAAKAKQRERENEDRK